MTKSLKDTTYSTGDGEHTEKSWDIKVSGEKKETKYQVKTVSAFANYRKISPLHKGLDSLIVSYLNQDLAPEGQRCQKLVMILATGSCVNPH